MTIIKTDNNDNTCDSNETVGFNTNEVNAMAALLFQKYGNQSVKIAGIFVDEHFKYGDNEKADNWKRVSQAVSEMILNNHEKQNNLLN